MREPSELRKARERRSGSRSDSKSMAPTVRSKTSVVDHRAHCTTVVLACDWIAVAKAEVQSTDENWRNRTSGVARANYTSTRHNARQRDNESLRAQGTIQDPGCRPGWERVDSVRTRTEIKTKGMLWLP